MGSIHGEFGEKDLKSNIRLNKYGEGVTNECLDGAISTNPEFEFYRTYSYGKLGCEDIPDYKSLVSMVPSSFEQDYAHDIFVDENGAVANAYILSDTWKDREIECILERNRREHPEYDYKMIEGSFPVDFKAGRVYNFEWPHDHIIMSTHILYITNYKDFIKSKTRTK